jgi:hypothetical protein
MLPPVRADWCVYVHPAVRGVFGSTEYQRRPIVDCGELAFPAFALAAPAPALLPRAAKGVAGNAAWQPRGVQAEFDEGPRGYEPVARSRLRLQVPSFLLGATHGNHLRARLMMVRFAPVGACHSCGNVARTCMGLEGTLYLNYSYLLFAGVGRLLLLPP